MTLHGAAMFCMVLRVTVNLDDELGGRLVALARLEERSVSRTAARLLARCLPEVPAAGDVNGSDVAVAPAGVVSRVLDRRG